MAEARRRATVVTGGVAVGCTVVAGDNIASASLGTAVVAMVLLLGA